MDKASSTYRGLKRNLKKPGFIAYNLVFLFLISWFAYAHVYCKRDDYATTDDSFQKEFEYCQSKDNALLIRLCNCEQSAKCVRASLTENVADCRQSYGSAPAAADLAEMSFARVDEELKGYNDALKELIKTENEIENDRMTWLLTINGALLAIMALLVDKIERYRFISYATGGSAILANISLGYSIVCSVSAIEQMEFLRKCLQVKFDEHVLPPVIGLGQAGISAVEHYLCPWNCLPVGLCLCWLVLADYILCKKEGEKSSEGRHL